MDSESSETESGFPTSKSKEERVELLISITSVAVNCWCEFAEEVVVMLSPRNNEKGTFKMVALVLFPGRYEINDENPGIRLGVANDLGIVYKVDGKVDGR